MADKRTMVDQFLDRCNCSCKVARRLTKKDFWTVGGYKKARPFEYWQSDDPKATAASDQVFRRLLAMKPSDFVDVLRLKRKL